MPKSLAVLRARTMAAVSRLDTSLAPSKTLRRLRAHSFDWRSDGPLLFLGVLALINLSYIAFPPLFVRVVILILIVTALLVPATSQFVLPASPTLSWLLLYFSSSFIPAPIRPHIWVSVLPTLESVLYGANISDILTRVTHPILDLMAWIPYGIGHYAIPFVVASIIFIFAPPGAVQFFGKAFGWMNILGVTVQILFPCSPPWYELRQGLTPADYSMAGSPGGLARIDAILGTNMYTTAFSGAPLIFGAFPSLHAACSTLEALFMSHFFPRYRIFYWAYVGVLYWSTMYLTHHYLIDLVAGGAIAICSFYYFLSQNDSLRHLPISFQQEVQMQEQLPHGHEQPQQQLDLERQQQQQQQQSPLQKHDDTLNGGPFIDNGGGERGSFDVDLENNLERYAASDTKDNATSLSSIHYGPSSTPPSTTTPPTNGISFSSSSPVTNSSSTATTPPLSSSNKIKQ